MEQEEFSKMQKLALEQLSTGKPLMGKGGVFAPLLKQFLEAALECEMEAHLNADERSKGNTKWQGRKNP